jgi:two-component system response regulator YesN
MVHNPEIHIPIYHKISLFDFIDRNIVDHLLKMVVDVCNIPVFVEQPMGREDYYASNSPAIPELCRKMMQDDEHCQDCKKNFAQSVHQAVTYGRPFVSSCPLGLNFAYGPLILNRGSCTACLVAGFVRVDDWQPEQVSMVEEIAVGLALPSGEIERMMAAVPVVDRMKLYAVADFLITNSLYMMKFVPLKDDNYDDFMNSDMAEARNLIHDFNLNEEERKKDFTQRLYNSNDEAKIIQAVSLGQRNVAEIRVRDFLKKLEQMYGNNPYALKGHIMELAVLISRAPLFQTNYANGEAFSLNHIPEATPPNSRDYYILKQWVITVLHQSLDIIDRKQNLDIRAKIIREAMAYIHSNLNQSIKVEEVALAVSFSSQHLSRIFREELGMNVSEYISKVRIEEAKRLLSTTSFSITQIADSLNFYDSTYFTKVFKRETGMNPSQYKRSFNVEKS